MKCKATLAALLVVTLAVVAAPAAGAKDDPPGLVLKAQKKVDKQAPSVQGEGPITIETTTTDATLASSEQLAQDGGLLSLDGSESLAGAAVTSTIWYQEWSQRMESYLWGILWHETHKGGYYFNGNAVWLRSRFGWDTGGYHRCGYGGGVLYDVSVSSCWKTGDPSWYWTAPNHMTNGDQFKVTVFFQGFPISATHEMRACMYPSGYLTGC